MKGLFTIFTIITFSTCSGSKHQTSNENLMANAYTIVELLGKDVSEKGATITFNLNENKVYGTSGCNNFNGSFTLDKNTIYFGPVMSTKKMCPDMTIEDQLFKLLVNKKIYSVQDNTLTLLGDDNTVILKAKIINQEKNTNQSKITTFEYKAVSRGYLLLITISNDGDYFTVVTDPNMEPVKQSFTEEEWDSLINALDKINLQELSEMEPPSKKFQYDGAPFTTLKITQDGQTFKSMAFDHGNPPEKIKEIVKILLSFAEKE